ncbi:Gfo/Idh/MocA family protein [Actinacidiphila acididurans]|uniref:Gfo/Idh/MocA family oxidoreductase n=1 Tax=Actinacidiphila acididurans TaxID=2784346 RepID=A0ABS2U3S9_9ACTN|nr:Gfo/Idh/MocA family oxidoreductase [Actinacidiphila acididurans]MBM9510265.1 Gfo/Idh/MocA family oxidoreductase [Actinacidiphila acididurans]
MNGPTRVAVIGAGDISDQYLTALTGYPDLAVTAVADLLPERARARAQTHGVPAWGSTEQVLARDDVDLVVNLTVPAAHADVALAAIAAGKHVWGEKPLALDRAGARAVLDAADAAGVVVGNAPDTVLGPGVQTAHRLLAGGAVGTPHTVLTLMQGPGPDLWHPRPQFLFAKGAGPLFDIGPYYLTALVQMLGPVVSVSAAGRSPRAERVVRAGPDAGTAFPVEVPTHLSVVTTFASGVTGTSVYSFDSPLRRQLFEITGSGGVMEVPVSGFDGDTRLLTGTAPDSPWTTVPAEGVRSGRGVGVLELARAIRAGRRPRASGELAYHVLDIMLAVEESAQLGSPVRVASSAPEVPPVPPRWDPNARTHDGTEQR